MLQPVYLDCPRGHHVRAARVSPGLLVRISGRCPACGEQIVEHGFATPFSGAIVPAHRLDRSTSISADEVERELSILAGNADAERFITGLPSGSSLLSTSPVLEALGIWLKHRGLRGAAVPEEGFSVRVEEGTDDPNRAVAFLERFIGPDR